MSILSDRITEFRSEYKTISFEQFQQDFEPQLSHTLSFPILFLYFKLDELMASGKVEFYKNLAILYEKKISIFHYGEENEYDFSLIKEDDVIIYTKYKQKIDGFDRTKVEEVLYQLADIFDNKNYKNAKKRTNAVTYPLNKVKKANYHYEHITEENLSIAKEVHDKWVEHKLKDEKLFKILFSKKKYYQLIENFVTTLHKYFKGFIKIGYIDDKPFAVEGIFLHDNIAYAATSLNLFFEFPNSYSEGTKVYMFESLMERGIKYFNFGIELNKTLKDFKSQYKRTECIIYKYRMKKEVAKTNETYF